MSYAFSNPYQQQSGPSTSQHPSLTESAKVLVAGLPLDVKENDLKELLLAAPLCLAPATTSVAFLYDSEAKFFGSAIVSVATGEDAEMIRRKYSGMQIDQTFVLTVHHILKKDQALPPPIPTLVARTTRPAPQSDLATATAPTPRTKSKQISPPAPSTKIIPPKKPSPAVSAIDKPLGLKLLARMSKSGQAKPDDKQLSLLDKQKANRAKNAPGAALLNRLQATPQHAAKSKPKPARLSTGAQKVERAKKASNAMDVDKTVVKQDKSYKKKTQAELDEEMRLYERARKFA